MRQMTHRVNARQCLILVLLISSMIALMPGATPAGAALPVVDDYIGATTRHIGKAYGGRPSSRNWVEQVVRRHSLQTTANQFTFVVTADMRMFSGPDKDTPQYFRGACEAIATVGSGAFMVSPGDIDPPADVEWTIAQYIGPDYIWYPVMGNHEAETPSDVAWLRAYDYDQNGGDPPNIVSRGPPSCEETTYSFDFANSHFVVLNVYCDGTSDTGADGDVTDALYDWLVDDLAATDKAHIFVFGHEPAYPQPDADNGRVRHPEDSLNAHTANRDRFWKLLKEKGVAAYICGHTHNYSAVEIDGVWQLDAGHARGIGETGAPSTFIMIHVHGDAVTFETYRDDADGGAYVLAHAGTLTQAHIYLPLIVLTRPQLARPTGEAVPG